MGFIIKENFLEKEFFNDFKKILFSDDFNWFFRNNLTIFDKTHYWFNHCFFNNFTVFSPVFDSFIKPILLKLNAKALIEARANCNVKNNVVYQSGWHVDKPFECTTAVLYMNTCNGYTLIDKDKKIKINSEENKILIFNSQIEHAVVSQTDVDRRIIINFNYF
jgi:hypothetical protein